MVENMRMTVFWDAAQYSPVKVTDVSEVLATSVIRVIPKDEGEASLSHW